MLNIAICDDDTAFSSQIEDIILFQCDEKKINAEIEVFTDGYYLLKSFKQGMSYNIIFLDIEMEKLDGLATAREIRKIDSSVLIIYISGFDDYLKELFEVEPFRFVSKPIQLEQLQRYCAEAIKKIEGMNNLFVYSYNKEEYSVPIKEIVYFESNKRLVDIHMNDGTVRSFYGKLNNLEKEIQKINKHFIRIHQSFLVNYSYIKSMTYSEVVLECKDEEYVLRISEDRRSTVRQKVCEIAGGSQS